MVNIVNLHLTQSNQTLTFDTIYVLGSLRKVTQVMFLTNCYFWMSLKSNVILPQKVCNRNLLQFTINIINIGNLCICTHHPIPQYPLVVVARATHPSFFCHGAFHSARKYALSKQSGKETMLLRSMVVVEPIDIRNRIPDQISCRMNIGRGVFTITQKHVFHQQRHY